MKTITVTNYTTSDGKTFKELAAAQRHEMTMFLSAGLKEGERLTAASVIDGMLAKPDAFAKKFAEITAPDAEVA